MPLVHCGLLKDTASFITHWGRVTHICVSEIIIIGSDNGLSPGRHQAIIWTNAGILLIRTLGTNFSEILCEIHSFSFSKMHLKMSSAKWRLFGLGLNELTGVLVMDIDGWLVTWRHLKQYWLIVNKAPKLICQWNFARNANILIKKMHLKL